MAQRITTSIIPPTEERVYIRTTAPINGEQSGWLFDPYLRLDSVTWAAGPKIGWAKLTYVPDAGSTPAVEDLLSQFSNDDQVQCRILPIDDEVIDQSDDSGEPYKVYLEGYLGRRNIHVDSDSEQSDEGITFTAFALPTLDNDGVGHIVKGRVIDGGSLIETPLLPAVFNSNGRPNRHATASLTAAGWGQTAHPFTHDDDPDGAFWTPATALRYLLCVHLFGLDGTALDRHVDVGDGVTLELVTVTDAGTDRTTQYQGLDDVLPEVDIQGLGLWDAIEKVCQVSGYRFSVEPATNYSDAGLDRRYFFWLWRRGHGPKKYYDLAKRGTDYSSASPEAIWRANNLNKLRAMWASDECVNQVHGVGKVLIEARFELSEGWDSDDESDATVDSALQSANAEQLATADSYHSKHVAGGSEFETYKAVGRRWVLAPDYDYVTELGLNSSALADVRSSANVSDTIVWTERKRLALPLRQWEFQARDSDYYLEVSEDGGASWEPTHVRFTTLREQFGIFLQVPNLAKVDSDKLGTDTDPDATASWWGILRAGTNLKFRLTCTIEADHAARYDALRQGSAASVYKRTRWLDTKAEEVWVQPGTLHNDGATWVRAVPYGNSEPTVDPDSFTDGVQGAAQRMRDALEGFRVSAAPYAGVLELEAYSLGDSIVGVRGRNISFGASAQSDASGAFPEVVEIHTQLQPGERQYQQISVDDTALAGGVR